MSDLRFLTDADPGWERAWGVIRRMYGDTECLHDGEVWQYMGTANGYHEFRHRSLAQGANPVHRAYRRVPVEHGDWRREDPQLPTFKLPS